MRYALVLAVAGLFAPAVARAADPPITFQTHPIDRVLLDLRSGAELVGGEKAVDAVNKSIKDVFGEKGFEGIDISRPLVGYVVLAPKPEDVTAVVALPVTSEKEFLALCDRANRSVPKDLGNGLYQLPPLSPRYKARVRFSNGHAYIAYGFNPEPALDPKALVPAGKLYDPAETAVVAAKFHFDRLTPEVKKALPVLLKEVKTTLFTNPHFGLEVKLILDPIGEALDKLALRYAFLGGADTAALRLSLDGPTGDLIVEATLTPKAGTALAKEIATLKPTGNRFGGLLTADTVAGFQTRLPIVNEELKAAGVKVLEEVQKMVGQGGRGKEAADELFKGLIRTAKTGEVDIVAGVRGPDKDGDFVLVGAVAFEDPAALEKEFKKFFEKDAHPGNRDRMKWDAAKAGTVTIHAYKLPTRNIPEPGKVFGGEKGTLAFAFAPKGVFFVVGPDPIPVIKDALAVKPADAPVLDVVVNPARLIKFAEKAGEPALEVERAFGKQDKLLSATSLRVTGGKELSVRYALDLRLLPRYWAADRTPVPEKPQAKFKR